MKVYFWEREFIWGDMFSLFSSVEPNMKWRVDAQTLRLCQNVNLTWDFASEIIVLIITLFTVRAAYNFQYYITHQYNLLFLPEKQYSMSSSCVCLVVPGCFMAASVYFMDLLVTTVKPTDKCNEKCGIFTSWHNISWPLAMLMSHVSQVWLFCVYDRLHST